MDHAADVYCYIADYAIRDLTNAIVRVGDLLERDYMKPLLLGHYTELNCVGKHLQRVMQELQEFAGRPAS